MTKINACIKYAANKGYHFDEDNVLVGISGKKLSLFLDSEKRYPCFCIDFYGEKHSIRVHRFKAYLLYGNKMFLKGIEVRHLNGNPLDFSDNNIVLGTQSQNMMDIPLEKRLLRSKKAVEKLRKFTNEEVEQIRKIYKYGIIYRKLSKAYKISIPSLWKIINNKTYARIC